MLMTNATVIVMTVPDPTDTAYFSTVAEAAALQGVSAADLAQRLNLKTGDLLTLSGTGGVRRHSARPAKDSALGRCGASRRHRGGHSIHGHAVQQRDPHRRREQARRYSICPPSCTTSALPERQRVRAA